MKYLGEYKNKHRSFDIYVVGSGVSSEYILSSFFNAKITIGVNQVYKFLQTTYLVRKETLYLKEVVDGNPNTIHFISKGGNGHSDTKNLDIIIKDYWGYKNIVIYEHIHNALRIMELPNEDQLITSHSTITTAIHLAAYMGASNIILVGHDCGSLDGKLHAGGYYDSGDGISQKYLEWLKLIEKDTIRVKEWIIGKYGCNIYSLNPFINFGLEGHKYER